MPITSAWTTPSLLDLAVGNTLPEAVWDNLVSNELYLWDTLHGFVRPASIHSLLIGDGDTNLYRPAANQLKTDDAFLVGDNLTAKAGAANQVQVGDVGGVPAVVLGSGADTNLYRGAANQLKTDDAFVALDNVTAKFGAANQVQIGDAGGFPSIVFGADTNLYRSAANTLKTDDSLVVAGDLTLATGTATAPNLATRLAETVLGAAAASLTFGSIPATYRHLRLVLSMRGDAAANNVQLLLRVNGDTGANYSYQNLISDSTVTSGGRLTAQTALDLGRPPGGTANAGMFVTICVAIACYKDTSRWKSVVASGEGVSSTAGPTIVLTHGEWQSTAAITSLTLVPASGSLAAGATATLYGEP